MQLRKKSGGVRELHGVEDGSWGRVAAVDYRNHCNYIRSKVNSGELWNATALEVISYLKQTQGYQPVTTTNSDLINISFNKLAIDTAIFTSDVTMNVVLPSTDFKYVYQGNNLLSYTLNGNTMSFNCYPHRGSITIYKTNNTQYKPQHFIQPLTSICKGQNNIVYEVPKETGVEYVWSVTGTDINFITSDNKLIANFGTNFTGATINVQGKVGNYLSLPLSIYVKSTGTPDYTVKDTTVCQTAVTLTAKPATLNYEWFSDKEGNNLISNTHILNAQVSSDSIFYVHKANNVQQHQGLANAVPGTLVYRQFAKLVVNKPITIKQLKSSIHAYTSQTVQVVLLNSTAQGIVNTSGPISLSGASVINPVLNWQVAAGTYYLGITGTAYLEAATVPINTANSSISGIYSFNGSFYITGPGQPGASVDGYNHGHHGVCYDITIQDVSVDHCPLSPVKVQFNPAVPANPVFVTAPHTVYTGTATLFSIQTNPGETYTWKSSPQNGVTINVATPGEAYYTFGQGLEQANIIVSATSCGNEVSTSHTVAIETQTTASADQLSNGKPYTVKADQNGLIISPLKSQKLTIFTVTGQQIYQKQIDSQTSVYMNAGLYILYIENESGTFTEKVAIQ